MFTILKKRRARATAALTFVLSLCLSGSAYALGGGGGSGSQSVSGFNNPGNLKMYTYLPSGLPENAPVIVVLHGCAQSASGYYDDAGWDKMADAYGAALLLPEQTSGNNMMSCFNWFEPGDFERGRGESASIVNALNKVIADENLDAGRVFITGVSAGGSMAAQMLAHYPEVFAGASLHASVVPGCASGTFSGILCTSTVIGSPGKWDNYVRNATDHQGPWPRVSIWQGAADDAVNPQHLTELMEQWTNVHGIDQTADRVGSTGPAAHRVYEQAGVPVVETWLVNDMGHGTAVNPGSGDTQCGIASKFFPDANVCSSYYSMRFWGLAD